MSEQNERERERVCTRECCPTFSWSCGVSPAIFSEAGGPLGGPRAGPGGPPRGGPDSGGPRSGRGPMEPPPYRPPGGCMTQRASSRVSPGNSRKLFGALTCIILVKSWSVPTPFNTKTFRIRTIVVYCEICGYFSPSKNRHIR